MAAKSPTNRRSTPKKTTTSESLEDQYDHPLEDAMAYEQSNSADEDYDEDESEAGYLERATSGIRELTNKREGRVVVAALATGFAIGAAIGCVIAGSRQRQQTWSDRLACEGLGRRMLDRLSSMVPDSITDKIHRS
jgi:lipid-binding SYLF domain-containing protein